MRDSKSCLSETCSNSPFKPHHGKSVHPQEAGQIGQRFRANKPHLTCVNINALLQNVIDTSKKPDAMIFNIFVIYWKTYNTLRLHIFYLAPQFLL